MIIIINSANYHLFLISYEYTNPGFKQEQGNNCFFLRIKVKKKKKIQKKKFSTV